jgi:lipoprotein-releasing system ATP-binding protein
MAAVLACNNLYRSYPLPDGALAVLNDLSLTVDAGEVVAILGPSGSGKSTLMHLLAGLDVADAGEVWWGDFAVHDRPPRALAARRSRTVGLIFQNHYLLDDLDVLENVTLPGRIVGSVDLGRGRELLAAVGLSRREGARPGTLSGGERQRVAVARALFLDPPVVLADEPTGSLDRENAVAVYELLVDLARDEGRAVLMVTHDAGLVASVDRRLALRDGALEAL